MRYEQDEIGRKIPVRRYGSQKSDSNPVYNTFPGSYGYPDWAYNQPFGTLLASATGKGMYDKSKQLSGQLEGMIGQQSPYASTLESALLNPKFGPQTGAENSLIQSLMDQTAGRSAVSGLGAPTQLALESAIAPTLVGLQNQYVQQLLGGQGAWQQGQNTNLQALLELLGYAMPQPSTGQRTISRGFQIGPSSGGVTLAGGGEAAAAGA